MNIQQKIIIFILIFLLIIFQTGFLPHFFKPGTIPSMLVVIITYYAFSLGFNNIWKWVFISGIFFDLLTFNWLGLNTLALIFVSASSSLLTKRFLILHARWKLFIVSVLIAVATIINELTNILLPQLLIFLKATPESYLQIDFFQLWLKIIYNIIIFGLLIWPFKKIESFVNIYSNRIITKRNA